MNIKQSLIKPLLISSFALAAAFGSNAWAANTARSQSSTQIQAQYDADMKQCKPLKGNDRDVCEQKAKATRDSAKADAKEGKKSSEAEHDAMKTKREAQYKVAKEKCDALSGDAKDQCIATAKTKYSE